MSSLPSRTFRLGLLSSVIGLSLADASGAEIALAQPSPAPPTTIHLPFVAGAASREDLAAPEVLEGCHARRSLDRDEDDTFDRVTRYWLTPSGKGFIEQRADRDGDGRDDSHSAWHYDPASSRLERVTHDLDLDGTADSMELYRYDQLGNLVGIVTDEGADGVADHGRHFEYRADGRLVKSWHEVTTTGRRTRITTYDLAPDGRIEQIHVDRDGDTTPDALSLLLWRAGLHVQTSVDDPIDGVVDSTVLFAHDDAGRVIRRDTSSRGSPVSTEHFEYTDEGSLSRHLLMLGDLVEAGTDYDYDAAGRLVSRRSTRARMPATVEQFAYFGCEGNAASVFWPPAPGLEGGAIADG